MRPLWKTQITSSVQAEAVRTTFATPPFQQLPGASPAVFQWDRISAWV